MSIIFSSDYEPPLFRPRPDDDDIEANLKELEKYQILKETVGKFISVHGFEMDPADRSYSALVKAWEDCV